MKAGKYMNNKKERIADAINRSRDELSKKIHDHPELGFEEFQAVEAISSDCLSRR